jgi:hypothetical protein
VTSLESAQSRKEVNRFINGFLAVTASQAPESGQPEVLLHGQLRNDASTFWDMGNTTARDVFHAPSDQLFSVEAN